MAFGKPLFPGNSPQNQLTRIYKLLGTPTEETFPGFTKLNSSNKEELPMYPKVDFKTTVPNLNDQGYDLLEKLLTYDPQKRISAKNALKHPYFEGFKISKVKSRK
eukprot:TRINITY_DN3839_c0_g2_i1.p1 TRINITY_DN3839_c0_g2~~TRINITY_DN3839_c0_g2_i1.p1  ORF type:complete len:105 (-),score=22.82 TRINITY_DN3839_c0_g2_i1:6-320(-)